MQATRSSDGTLCLTFDNMGRARDIAEGRASTPDYEKYARLVKELDIKIN